MGSVGLRLTFRRLSCVRTPPTISFTALRNYTAEPAKPKKATADGHTPERFVDSRKVRVVGGHGGNGVISFLRAAHKEFGGPDGGNGGTGGHVIFTSTMSLNNLGHLKSVIRADAGITGRNCNRQGKNAQHLYIEVPLGTLIIDENGKHLTSLEEERDYYIAARGGAGGKGNNYFVTSIDTIPRYAEEGGVGETRTLHLELKMMADAGLIGFPNAGKSTLLRAISRARPKVAPYAFTTLHPHVGMVQYEDYEQVAVADIPGLIPDAHKNRGLGFAFLRHIERCSCLLYVIDLSVDAPWEQLESLKYELEQYSPGLSERPNAIIGNKMDLEISGKNFLELQKKTDLPVIPVSAEKKQNLKELLTVVRRLYDVHSDRSRI